MPSDNEYMEQLKQIADAPNGVWAGDLINKTAARDLVERKLVRNSGGPPSSLNVLTLSETGRIAVADNCIHDFGGWREIDGGRGGEQFCQKCGYGAMAHTLRYAP